VEVFRYQAELLDSEMGREEMTSINYEIDIDTHECITQCPFYEQHWVGSNYCISQCNYMQGDDFDEHESTGLVECGRGY
jgi:hypothetical protein